MTLKNRTKPREMTIRESMEALLDVVGEWTTAMPEALALRCLCDFFLEERSSLLLNRWVQQDKHQILDQVLPLATEMLSELKQREQAQLALWGRALARDKRISLFAEYQRPLQLSVLHEVHRVMKKNSAVAFPYYQETDHFLPWMAPAARRFYQSVFGRQARPNAMWNTFIDKYQQQFGLLSPDIKHCLHRLCVAALQHADTKEDMTIFHYITLTRDYGFPIQLELLPVAPAGATPAASTPLSSMISSSSLSSMATLTGGGGGGDTLAGAGNGASASSFLLMQTTQMVWDFINAFGSKDTLAHVETIHNWYQGIKKEGIQERAQQWAVYRCKAIKAVQQQQHQQHHSQPQPHHLTMPLRVNTSPPSPPYTSSSPAPSSSPELAEKVDLARRHITCLYQRFMSLWRMNQFARDLFQDLDFPGNDNIKQMLEFMLPLERAHYQLVMHGHPSEWDTVCPKVYRFLEQVALQ